MGTIGIPLSERHVVPEDPLVEHYVVSMYRLVNANLDLRGGEIRHRQGRLGPQDEKRRANLGHHQSLVSHQQLDGDASRKRLCGNLGNHA